MTGATVAAAPAAEEYDSNADADADVDAAESESAFAIDMSRVIQLLFHCVPFFKVHKFHSTRHLGNDGHSERIPFGRQDGGSAFVTPQRTR